MDAHEAHVMHGIRRGTAAYRQTLDALSDQEWREPSVLPGWSRAHVVAHVILNARGFAGAFAGLANGEPVAVYESNRARDADIETWAAKPFTELRTEFAAAHETYLAAYDGLSPEQRRAGSVERIAGAPPWLLPDVIEARWREVEIHHADLGAGYTADHWPDDFATALLESATYDRHDDGPFVLEATDLGRRWTVGEGDGEPGPRISGSAGALGWWLVGRGAGEGLNSSDGLVPTLGPWVRRPR